jgi:aryl-phospho-beta-D-glucosidase BglC (GH1 family)
MTLGTRSDCGNHLHLKCYDNSGRRGSADWGTQESNVERTKAVIQSIAEESSDPQYYGVVTALSVLNEPAGYLNSQLLNAARQFNSETTCIQGCESH